MGQYSPIEWCDHTFNPWVGCQEVSPACDHCYARTMMTRKPHWATAWSGDRFRTSRDYWRAPLAWDRAAEKIGLRHRVLCASLADVFDNQVDPQWRAELWHLIALCPWLDWLLLTKRPQNFSKFLPRGWGPKGWPQVWLGVTVENQEEADRRVPILRSTPARRRFLSCEPLLEAVRPQLTGIDWVIAGGETGPGARPLHPDWARSLRDQCRLADAAFFFKQWGDYGPEDALRKSEPMALANDGTLYRSADLTFPDGARRGEAIRADHDKAHLTAMYRVGRKAAGADLDGVLHRAFPPAPALPRRVGELLAQHA